MKTRGPFLIVIRDDDTRTFCFEETYDDRPLIERVVRAQRGGRKVNCFTTESARQTAKRDMERQGYREVAVPL
jgi:hypothetical protein